MRRLFVAGIGTDVGKTVISAILVESLKADYFKPIQCGSLDDSDTMWVRKLVENAQSTIHEEAYRLNGFMSPHAAAKQDGVNLEIKNIDLPDTDNTIIIEGAGGLMVPINDREMVVDLIPHFNAETVLVSQNYLGSINHTILSVELLKARGIKIAGIIFNGDTVPATEEVILEYTGVPCLGRVGQEENLSKEVISNYADKFQEI
jgi:dethiobiotin synthetase